MADYVELIRTEEGDKPVNYNALANKPIQRIESMDSSNRVNLRDLESGTYILYGYFKPFAGSPNTISCDNQLVSIDRLNAGSHVLVFTALNAKINFLEILVDDTTELGFTYSRTDISMLDLHGLIEKVSTLESRVAALEGA